MRNPDIPLSLHPLVGQARDIMPEWTRQELQSLLLSPDPAALGEAIQGPADVRGDGEHTLISLGELLQVVDWAAFTEVERALFSSPDLWPTAVAPVVGWVHNPDEDVDAGPRLIEGLPWLLALRLLIEAVMPGADWTRFLIRCRCRSFNDPIQGAGGRRSPPTTAAHTVNPSQRRTTP